MGFVGNKNGPRKSEIVAKLGNHYFGISKTALAEEIEIYLEEERSGEVDPIHVDKNNRPYLNFIGPGKRTQKFYLEEHGYNLHGKTRAIINNQETEIEIMGETKDTRVWHQKKDEVREKITRHLQKAHLDELIRQKSLSESGVFSNLTKWMEDETIEKISPNAKRGILNAIKAKRWSDVSEAFYTDIEFGTGGIRGRSVILESELELLRDDGIKAPFLRGPNTINDIVFAQISAAIARFGQDRKYQSIVIGYDSRIREKTLHI